MMIKEGIMRTYARACLLRIDNQLDPMLIDQFLNCPAFLDLTAQVDQNLIEAMAEFKAKQSSQAVQTTMPDASPKRIPAAPIEKSGAGMPLASDQALPDVARSAIAFRLANARVGAMYSQAPIPLQPPPEPIIYLDIAVPPELGLAVDLASGTISGAPLTAGEFDIPIRFHLAGEPALRRQGATVSLLVNQDPKSMWKNRSSDRSDIFWKPDEQCSAVAGADCHIVAASKRGRSHAHVGSFRDDDYLIDHLRDTDWYIAVVSDGAGSAKYSRRGSQIICRQAAAYLKRTLEDAPGRAIAEAAAAFHAARNSKPLDPFRIDAAHQLLHASLFATVGHAAHHAVKAIHEEIASHPELNAAYKDFSSTAMISACRRFPFGTLCVAYWVGDGAVGVYSKEHGITLLGDVDSGEFSGQTRFLDNSEVTGDALSMRTRFVLIDDMTALVLMTDGISDPKFDTEANLSRRSKWDELWQDLDHAAGCGAKDEGMEQRLLSWLDFWSPGNHDDRTIVLILQENHA